MKYVGISNKQFFSDPNIINETKGLIYTGFIVLVQMHELFNEFWKNTTLMRKSN